MAQFLTTKGSIARIEDVFTFARGELHLITPFVQLTDTHVRRLRDADARGVCTTLVCRYDDLKREERRFFADLANGRVFDDPDLHAKCFINERGLVLTSLNLYAASEQNNEMGVWLDAQEDREAYERAVEEAQSIREHAREVGASSNGSHRDGHSTMQTQRPNQRGHDSENGFCIHCGTRVDYDPARPYCRDCYRVWARWENPAYEEPHCHSCGSDDGGYTMAKPECYGCFKENVAA